MRRAGRATGDPIRHCPKNALWIGSGWNHSVWMSTNKVSPETIRNMKGRKRIPALTAYDYPLTRLVDAAGVPLILVGDSLGMVTLGYPDTTYVTLEDMEHHVRAAARARPNALLAADLPYRSYETPDSALASARRLIAAGAEAVKLEGGRAVVPQVEALVQAEIPVIGHLGMLPQSIHEEGRYHIKGRAQQERQTLFEDAGALRQAGAFSLVLELVTPTVAGELTKSITIPTIGIGSGPSCDGQILVTTDLLGYSPNFIPRHVHPKAHLSDSIVEAVKAWAKEVNEL